MLHRPRIADNRQDRRGVLRRRYVKLQTCGGQRVGHDPSISIRHERDVIPPRSHRQSASTAPMADDLTQAATQYICSAQ